MKRAKPSSARHGCNLNATNSLKSSVQATARLIDSARCSIRVFGAHTRSVAVQHQKNN
jgi:hypothetical protein